MTITNPARTDRAVDEAGGIVDLRKAAVALLALVVVAIGQEYVRVLLKDGTFVTGRVGAGDAKSFVVETDTGQVKVVRSTIAQVTTLPQDATEVGKPVSGTSLRDLGFAAGYKAADDAVGVSWFASTCCAGGACWPAAVPIAISLAWRSRGRVPPSLSAGLSGDYAAGFNDGYSQRATEKRHAETMTGLVVGGVVFTLAVMIVRNQFTHVFSDFHPLSGDW